MSILGFSHIVTEVKDLNVSQSFYEKLGFELVYAFDEKVLPEKQKILKGNPHTVQLMYYRHPQRPSVGIELIKHSVNSYEKDRPNIAYAWLNDRSQKNRFIDPQGNSLIAFSAPQIKCAQHIFMPVASLEDSLNFYQTKFLFQSQQLEAFPKSIYKDLYGTDAKTAVLGLTSCLSPNWNACLHLIETPEARRIRFLNDCGFSCFCLLVDQAQYASFVAQGLHIIGPFEGRKMIQGNESFFTIGFIEDPDGFLVEFYISGRILNPVNAQIGSRHG